MVVWGKLFLYGSMGPVARVGVRLSGAFGPYGEEGDTMPAIFAEPMNLPRLEAPQVAVLSRRVASITDAPHAFEGDGFPVRRAFAGVDQRLLDPFIHMDHMGEVEYSPGEAKGTPWHPHRGFETVTYMIDGTFEHQDSNGGGGRITDWDTQWMTAGAGILHIERPPEKLVVSGGLFHGFQLWVNLPAASKWIAPRYQDIRGSAVTLLSSHDGTALLRLIAGRLGSQQDFAGPGITHTPITMVHATVLPGGHVFLPWDASFNALFYVLSGRGEVGSERLQVSPGQLVAFHGEGPIEFFAAKGQESRSPALDVLVLGGKPIGEPVAWAGPFVMNTHAELAQAFDDYRSGRLGSIPAGALGQSQ